MTLSEMNAAIAADRAEREAREAVTIRQVSRRAGRSSAKEAVGDREKAVPLVAREANEERLETRQGHDDHAGCKRDVDHERHWAGSYTASRRDAVRPGKIALTPAPPSREQVRGHREPHRMSEPLPARDLMECAARERMEAHETPRALAYYRLLGRLHEADEPVALAAALLARNPEAVVVVSTDDEERRLRAALAGREPPTPARVRDGSAGTTPSVSPAASGGPEREAEASAESPDVTSPEPRVDAWAGRVIRADPAYEARWQKRETWAANDPRAQRSRHLVEPGAVQRAYVVASEPLASAELVRAVSVAAESHLVTPPLRPGLAKDVEAEAQHIRDAQDTRARERTAEQAREAELTHQRQAGRASATRELAREMER